MNRLWMVIAAALSIGAKGADEARPARRFALVAGSNDGGSDRVKLRYATSDARSMASVLEELGGVAPGDEVVLLDSTAQGLRESFARLHRSIEEAKATSGRVELLFYYSGHSDEEGLLIGGERLGYDQLRKSLGELPADVRIAILDSCASGALTRGKGGARRPAFLNDASAEVKGHAFLTSSSADEAAQESDKIGASFFTHYLVSGLRGAADTTRDGRVSLTEAYQFAFQETLARTERTRSGPQHPAYDIALVGTGDLVMTDLSATNASLLVVEDLAGRLFVRDAAGKLVAELLKNPGRAVELGLPAGKYRVTLDATERKVFEGQVVLRQGERTELSSAELALAAVEMTAARGDVAPPPQPAVEPEPGTIRERRPLAVALGMGWNDLAGLGPVITFHPLPHVSLDAGGGFSVRGLKGGLRVRGNLWTGSVTPFVGVGMLFATGPGEMDLSATGNPLVIRVRSASFAQATAGVEYLNEGGFTCTFSSGYSFLLGPPPVQVVSGTPDEAQEATLDFYGSGLIWGFTWGFGF